jgi:hypothetical protein
MKSVLSLIAVCAVVALAGCANNKSNSVAPGAVGESKSGCCSDKAACTDKNGTSMGAVGEKKSGCCAEKAGETNMGAVGDKTECHKVCPVTGKSAEGDGTSLGAVGEKKSGGCCKSSGTTKVDG